MPRRYRLTKMEYDEVSLVDAGACDDAHVLLFKRATPISKDLLTPDDVHSPVPLGSEPKQKRPRKGQFNHRQARDHRGKWVRGGHFRAHTSAAPAPRGYVMFGKNDSGWGDVSKLTRAQTNQSVSSGPRGEDGGSWNETKHARTADGKFATSDDSGGRDMTNPNISISRAPSMKSGKGGGKGKKGAKGKKAAKPKLPPAPISPISPANKPMVGTADQKIANAQDNATAAHAYADQMKQYAADMAKWAKENPSPQHDAQAQRAAQAAQRAQYTAERADATVAAQKAAAAKTSSKTSSSTSTTSTGKTPPTLDQLLTWMNSMTGPLSKKNHRGTWQQV